MTIEWLAGNRLRGTTAERPNFGSVPSGSVGGWKEIARTTMDSNASTFTVSIDTPDKLYYHVLVNPSFTSAGSGNAFTLGTGGTLDPNNNYAFRRSTNDGSDVVQGTQGGIVPVGGFSTEHELMSLFLTNQSGKEKLCIFDRAYSIAGKTNAPQRIEDASKWTGTGLIDIMKAQLNSGGGFVSGTEIVVLGYDPSDTHTDNFWTPLADVELPSAGNTLSSGTITAKKYLWIQTFIKSSGNTDYGLRFNSDSGTNYANRQVLNGVVPSPDSTTEDNMMYIGGISDSVSKFNNIYIINNSANEKLSICRGISQNAAGAGSPPQRREAVSKWANTSEQITEIQLTNVGTGDFDAGTIMKVWGAN
jgi:hypothetical protein